MHTIITDKNLKKTRLKELHTTPHEKGYQKTLINKGFELAEKILQTELKTLKETQHRKTPSTT